MREILFRGKRIDNGEWVEGSLVIWKDGSCSIEIGNFEAAVDPSTVGQYTGMTDKNGKRIFEGDVVKAEYKGNNKGLDGVGEVVFKECKFALVWGWHKEIVCLTHFDNVEFEVIGNIHDNPDLLEVHHE